MIYAYGPDTIRVIEEPLLRAGVPLMERASGALALAVQREAGRYGLHLFVLAGPGHNGGDALYAAARLVRQGASAAAACFGAPHEGALEAARSSGVVLYDASVLEPNLLEELVVEASRANVWLDGLLGIGGRPGLSGAMAQAVETLGMVRGQRTVIAVDLPSGVDGATGAAPGPVLPADVTVTVGAPKPALYLEPAKRYAGRIQVADIGLNLNPSDAALAILEPGDLTWHVPGPDDHKYTRGVVGIRAGSLTYPGAACLCVEGALAAGPGMVRYAGPVREVLLRNPEVVLGEGRVDAWVIGPGLDAAALEEARLAYRRALAAKIPVILDAGAVAFAGEECGSNVVLTPHAGELATLFSTLGEDTEREAIEAEPMRWARRAAELTGAVVLLKGAVDVACAPKGTAYAAAGSPWRATAGSGDVLAGVVGAALASGLSPLRAAAEAAYLHAAASRGRPTRASMIARGIAAARVADLDA